ncbi:MAG: type II secretion system F family protein [Pseudomonadota bacterium]
MPAFTYKAVDRNGQPARGKLDAANEIDLELRLKRMGLDLITSQPISRSAARARGNITRRDLITFCFDLEQVTRSGIPLLDGLRDLRDGVEKPRFREVITSLTEDMEGGKVLSQCLAEHPQVFDHVFVSLIKTGEQTGKLTEVLASLGESLKWQDELVSQTRRLLVYPVMVLTVVISVVLFLLLYLVPQVVSLLTTMGLELPWQTRALIALSNFVAGYWWLIFGLPLAVVLGGIIAVQRDPKAKYLFDYLKLHVPVTGIILQKIIMARFANFFALMYSSGITILDALKTSEDIVANRVVADGLMRAGQQIGAGESLSETFRNLGIFPPLVIRMLRVGETTGALDSALQNINYFYMRDVRESIDKALKLLEPALTLVLGAALAAIMFSVLTPVYDIIGKLQL